MTPKRVSFVFFTVAFFTAALSASCGGSDASNTTPTDDGGSDVLAPDVGPTADTGPSDATGGDSSVLPGTTSACGPNNTIQCGTMQVCDPVLGCVSCLGDGDCAARPGKFCIQGACEACRSNTDCAGTPATPSCFPRDHACHAACNVDAAVPCPGGGGGGGGAPICNGTTGQCVGCETSATCPINRPICDAVTASCVECTTNAACPLGQPRCFLGDFRCVECLANADCGSGKICGPDLTCVTGCASDAQCGAAAPKCNTALSTCVECLTTPDCAGTATPFCSTRDRCVQCLVDGNCAQDGGTPFCDQQQCVECRTNANCPAGKPQCDNGQCKP